MHKLHVVQAGFLMPVITELEESGVNVGHLLRSSKLDKFKLDDPNHYVPVECMHNLFTQISRQQGIDELAEQFSEGIKVASLSQWGKLVSLTPDLLSAFQFGVKNSNVVMSNEHLEYEINGTTTTFKQSFSDKPSFGRDQTEFLAFSLLIRSVQIATGDNWVPLEIHFQSNNMPNLEPLFPYGCNAKFYLGQPATAIKLPTSMLSMSMAGKNPTPQLDIDFPEIGSLSTRIMRLLDSINYDLNPSVNLITEISNSSTRTLQRSLAKEGTSVSSIIDQWRFSKALKLLENPKLNSFEISELLGYSDPSNFNRAFCRWTKTTPGKYRDDL